MKTKVLVAVSLVLALTILSEPLIVPHAQAVQQQECVPIIVGVIIITVAGIIITGLVKICRKCLPKNPCPPPPEPPAQTNAPPRKTMTMALNFDTNNVSAWDISSSGFTDPHGAPYLTLQSFSIQTATNVSGPWNESLSVTQWVSDASVMTVAYTNGIAVQTNWWDSTDGTGTNGWPVNLVNPAEPQRFFKVGK